MNDVSRYFSFKRRSAAALCAKWVKAGFLVVENPSTKGRTYRLAGAYETLVAARAGKAPGGTKRKPRRRRQ